MSKTVIATYFWQPDQGSKFAHAYTSDDVRRLQTMVSRNLTIPHEFVVITDKPEVFAHDRTLRAVRIDRTTRVPGTCFVRLMTFSPYAKDTLGERVLQIDLDTVIVGNLDHLVSRNEELVLWRNPSRIPWDKPLKPGRPYYNTSLLLHKTGTYTALWDYFDPKDPGCRDDQWWISEVLGGDMPYFDGEKDGVYRLGREDTPGSGVNGTLPANACLVTFPGSDGKATPSVMAANPWIAEHRV